MLLSSVQAWTGIGCSIGDFRSQRRVDIFLGEVVAFPNPVVDVNSRFLPLFERGSVSFFEAIGVFV